MAPGLDSAADPRLHPKPWQPNYLMRRALTEQVRGQIARRLARRSELEVLDVGCGRRPYEPLVAPYTRRYTGVDARPAPGVDAVAPADALPFDDASFDLVLCTQVLEHVESPASVVSELRRVLRPAGVALASTHGVMRYHPDPADYWRWTHAGLERLFRSAGDWSELQVQPNGGTATALGFLIGWQLEGLARRRYGATVRPLIVALNALALNGDRILRRLGQADPPALAANYLVTAVR